MIGVYELDGLHWVFGIMWALFMLWSLWCIRMNSRLAKKLGEKEQENQRLREAIELSRELPLPPETSNRPDGLGLPVGGR